MVWFIGIGNSEHRESTIAGPSNKKEIINIWGCLFWGSANDRDLGLGDTI